ncbi:N-acetyltransferase 5 [Coemansia sp. RSA 989]|nr:acyl-CoA N-acyltransferase [Coemansia mojavensis]KAJ1742976.1 N-acetyltransferase 5 [Coemansia sp. RSA 1086]KAJ1752261.1 N-acetyltransferase 5 [Coemansia sp. RSA 1821]KAJ1866717.1 N-acetyltransferase 5 [Coemansia sp. RSA 989]KAJ1873577.1 N-acetyltransferase 5 [Coemansia sp. RSA 990]KAJ2648768.1 N-acetyltransferase 5 [Coemansia sp. RSA 1250]KAJ2671036.1 N-acetyltransferase 5 [Coemansia sp. RSA 1085]
MSTIRRFRAMDLFRFNNINLDRYTETYDVQFYLNYMCKWPDLFTVAESPADTLMGYNMGKLEGEGELWHGHVTALTVAPECRRLGLARGLMRGLEEASEKIHNCYFVDLFVRPSNSVAVSMYEAMGYILYRQVIDYYMSDGVMPSEYAYDMRKALPRDVDKKSIVPVKHPVHVEDTFF